MGAGVVTVLEAFDDLVSGTPEDELAAWVTEGTTLATERVRCPVGEEGEARQRLDLALRLLRTQAPCQWCRPTSRGTVLVRRWPLPARAAVLYGEDGDDPSGFVLAIGRPRGRADAWRFRFDEATAPILDRGRALLPT